MRLMVESFEGKKLNWLIVENFEGKRWKRLNVVDFHRWI